MSEREPQNLENKIRAILGSFRKERISAHEGGHAVDIDAIPPDQEIVLFQYEIYNQSVSTEEDPRLKPD